MKIRSLSDSLEMVTFRGFVNVFLLRDGDGLTLVDTALPGCGEGIIEAAASLGGPIRRIALTHAHPDHIGSLDALAARLPGVEVAIGERHAALLKKDLRLLPTEAQKPLRSSFYPGARTRPAHLLRDGDRFGSLRCIDTPGHAPGHVSYLDERDGTLFSGDALVSLGGPLRISSEGPMWFPLHRFLTWDAVTARASGQKLSRYKAVTILNAHGGPVFNAVTALQEAVLRAPAR